MPNGAAASGSAPAPSVAAPAPNAAVACSCLVYVQNYIGYTGATYAKDAGPAIENMGHARYYPSYSGAHPTSGDIVIMQPNFAGADATAGHIGFISNWQINSDGSMSLQLESANWEVGTPFTDNGCNNVTYAQIPSSGSFSASASGIAFYRRAVTQTLPAAPSNLSATALSSSSIQVKWHDNSNNETSFVVEWWNGSSWVTIAYAGANVTSWTISNLAPSHLYNFEICAHNSAGTNCAANYTWATTLTPPVTLPAAPSNLSATALSSSSIQVKWQDNSNNETSFVVEWWNGSSWVTIGYLGANVTSATVVGLLPSHTYYFTIYAHNSAGDSWAVNYTGATTLASAPAAPSNLSATATSPTNIHVAWHDNATNETGYRITDGVSTVLLGANATSFDWGVDPSTYKCFSTQAYNSAGSSAWTSWGCTTSWATAPGGMWISPAGGASLSGTVTFSAHAYPTNSGDPAISYVNFTADIGGWKTLCTQSSHSGDVYSCDVNLASFGAGNGSYTVSFDVYDSAGRVHQAPTGTRSVTYSVPVSHGDVIVDDQSSGFAQAGTLANWNQYSGGYNSHFWWTNTRTSGVDNRAMWTPNLPAAGNWQVFVFVPAPDGTTTNARYRVDHNGSQSTVQVNQNAYSNVWVGIGTYYFPSGGGTNGEVFLGNETYETSTHQIAFDAVKWVWVGP